MINSVIELCWLFFEKTRAYSYQFFISTPPPATKIKQKPLSQVKRIQYVTCQWEYFVIPGWNHLISRISLISPNNLESLYSLTKETILTAFISCIKLWITWLFSIIILQWMVRVYCICKDVVKSYGLCDIFSHRLIFTAHYSCERVVGVVEFLGASLIRSCQKQPSLKLSCWIPLCIQLRLWLSLKNLSYNPFQNIVTTCP